MSLQREGAWEVEKATVRNFYNFAAAVFFVVSVTTSIRERTN